MTIRDYEELRVYRSAFAAAMTLFELSKAWPKEERYALTDQVRRSSRAVCANVAEAWAKRRYPKHFVTKLTDADGEAAETETWLRFGVSCGYITPEDSERLVEHYRTIRGGLARMMASPEDWCGLSGRVKEHEAGYITVLSPNGDGSAQ